GFRRIKFYAENIAAAIKEAPVKAGLVAAEPLPQIYSLAEAFKLALEKSSRGTRARKDWVRSIKRFMQWLVKNHPDCVYWHLMTRQIITGYLDTLNGKSSTHRRLSVQPICQTSRFMSLEHGMPHIAAGLGVGLKLKSTPARVFLLDVIDFLSFLEAENPRLETGAALQGLAGLQLQEATRLTWDRVDLERGLIEISGETKNEYRIRVIPVADRVVAALIREKSRQRSAKSNIRSITDSVVLSAKGCSYGENSFVNYSKQIREAMLKWNPEIDWKPKDLRNCLPTFAAIKGLSNDIWEQYIGHAPRTVTQRHYVPRLTAASLGEREQLDEQMEVFRRQVVDPLNTAVKGVQVKLGGTKWHPETLDQRIHCQQG
ncbi:tyrosine-type recombinase/integrase, partial [Candidatus Sumerlaeota bacterium]